MLFSINLALHRHSFSSFFEADGFAAYFDRVELYFSSFCLHYSESTRADSSKILRRSSNVS